jgi:hypothetical protein
VLRSVWTADEVIVGIDVYPVPLATGLSFDGTREMESQATTWGQFLSKPMHEFLKATMPDTFAAALRGESLGKGVFAKMRSAGIDLIRGFARRVSRLCLVQWPRPS